MKKRKIDRSFLNNRGVNILLSLGIALLIWTIVTVYIDPDQTNRLKGVPVNFEQDSQMYTSLVLDIINDPMAQVTVELAGNGTTSTPLPPRMCWSTRTIPSSRARAPGS